MVWLFALFLASVGNTAEPSSSLTVVLTGFEHNNGSVVVHLYDQSSGYPTKPEKSKVIIKAAIASNQAEVTFSSLAPGNYAISAYHDENGNGELDTNFIGIPREGLGASNDAKGFMGPPSFEDAKFAVAAGASRHGVTMSY